MDSLLKRTSTESQSTGDFLSLRCIICPGLVQWRPYLRLDACDLRACECGAAFGISLGSSGRCNEARIFAFFSSTILRSLGVKCSVSSLNFRRPLIGVSPPFATLQCARRIGHQRLVRTCHRTGRLPSCLPLSTVLPFVSDQMRRKLESACLRKRMPKLWSRVEV